MRSMCLPTRSKPEGSVEFCCYPPVFVETLPAGLIFAFDNTEATTERN